MFDRLEVALREAESAMADVDPKLLIGTQPSVGVDLLIRHERVTAAARLAMVARAEEMHPWQREGFRSFEDWLAAKEGTSRGQARRKARRARKLRDRDKTADALADGEISEDEADVIADAADKNPAAEQELLDTAKNKGRSHDDLRKKAADAKAAGEDDKARADRLRRGRTAGWGVDREGFWTLRGRFEPHVGAEMKAHLAAETERVFAAARAAGTREGHDRYRADAVANLIRGRTTADSVESEGSETASPATDRDRRAAPDNAADHLDLDLDLDHRHGSDGAELHPDLSSAPPGASRGGDPTHSAASAERTRSDRPESGTRVNKELVIDINLETLRRGRVLSGETCQIRGVGPVPVEVARQWADDAFVKAVIRDGTDIKTVVHFGRHLRAEVRTALGVRDQHHCQVPGCDNPRIEYDHDRPHADHGPTSTTNLRALCVPHHRQRTHHGHELHGPPGDRCWTDPDGNVLFADDPAKVTGPVGFGDGPRPLTATTDRAP